MLKTDDPYEFRYELEKLKELINNTELTRHEKNLLANCFKHIMFYNYISETEIFSYYLQSIIYDSLNSIISIIKKTERYYQLNIRSLIEHIARISMNKQWTGEPFSDFIRRKDFIYLKKNGDEQVWNFLHQLYSTACLYIHSSPSAKLNINHTFSQLIKEDTHTAQKKQVETLQKCLNYVTKILIFYFNSEISTSFMRSKIELKFLIGDILFKEYEALNIKK
ncbi:hypothetical protein AYY18_05865 [Morganella psychrotolerans]|uniref:Uncharacterized protein n=2 Tax=Morganella psychrotolerans TaxID=368603 RepID=A0A1B8HFI3_9GAMM|nr:hypothetical protein AYY18_05865 [Morganella psychrotolerans]